MFFLENFGPDRPSTVDSRLERLEDRVVSRMDRQFYWVLTLIVLSI